ncbi:MAG: family 78 glycoside hydrolase catalytic domain [Kiritimatiellae bacterium]|jgi:alpha-L-rhamnosidase|nr:family 78 glycoside hydrolase catalytic domain [Kiritimatiellia bacterium]
MFGKSFRFNLLISGLITALLAVSYVSAAAPTPENLTICEGFSNPIGLYDATPVFSWKLPLKTKAQSAYQLVAASTEDLLPEKADLWDSGKVTSSQSAWIPYAGKALNSRQEVFWQIRYWDENGDASKWSKVAQFELGLLENSDWKGRWIRKEIEKVNPNKPAPEIKIITGKSNKAKGKKFVPEYLRRTFAVEGQIVKARLFVTAKGLYEIYINGDKVGHDYMAPGWTPYHARIETLTYDVIDQIRNGKNAIGAIIGEGWYAGDMMAKKFIYPEAKPALLLQLELTMKSGTKMVVTSGKDWKSFNQGPIRYSNIYHGEEYDANMMITDWNTTEYDDSSWSSVVTETIDPKIALVPKRHHAVRTTEELVPVNITEPTPGRYVFDLGQNMVGWPRISLPAEKGAQITIRFAEMLEKDGTLYTANYRSAKSTAYYTAAEDGKFTWHPTFTFFGFRYVEISGTPTGEKPDKSWVTGVVLHSDFKQTGSFKSSHDKLNLLQRNITWGQRGNFLDIPTDCPQRNERLGWTGDAQVFCPTSFFNYDVLSFWMSWLESVREEQTPGGLICHTVPTTGCGAGSPGWGDVGVTAPWDAYVRSGHKAILEENYDMMKKWVAAYEREAKDFIVNRKGYGDWLQPYQQGKGNRADTPMEVIATAYFGRCAAIMSSTARALGNDKDAAYYDKLLANIQNAFSKTFFDDNGRLTTKFQTQTGYLMALGYDLLPLERRAGALAGLLEELDKADGHLRTGFLGTPLIAPVLDRFNQLNKAYGVLFKETYPSWFFSINQGATTMWERWNSYSHTDGFGNAGMNSFNHYAYGAIGQWMYERMAGLAPDPKNPGYKHFFVQPNPSAPLTSASAELETPYGKALSSWKKEGSKLTVNAIVPPNTTATLVVPQSDNTPTVIESDAPCETVKINGRHTLELTPGEYEFSIY